MADRLSALQGRLRKLKKDIEKERDGTQSWEKLDKLAAHGQDVINEMKELKQIPGMYGRRPSGPA